MTSLLDGKMFAGIIKTDLMVRLHPQAEAEALTKPGVRPMDFTGRPMKGYLYVVGDALIDDEALVAWMGEAMAYVATLPEKAPKPPKKPKA